MLMKKALVIFAIVVAVAVSTIVGLRMIAARQILSVLDASSAEMGFPSDTTGSIEQIANSCYPFRWEQTQYEHLRQVLRQPRSAPKGSGDYALARYAQYALHLPHETTDFEKIMREGMRRDPQNALYHYLLADYYLKQALEGHRPRIDKASGKFYYDYRVTNRALLDRGMQEFALGTTLPYATHRDTILRAQLDALPPKKGFEDQFRETGLLANVKFPEFPKARNFARVNGFYLSLLLKEGKRTEAQPFLHTGERFVVHLAQDNPPTLIGMLVTLACSKIHRLREADVCRQHGLALEATELERRHTTLAGELEEWRIRVGEGEKATGYYKKHVSILCGILMPRMNG